MPRRKKRKWLAFLHLPQLNLDEETKRGIKIIAILALGFIAFLGLFGKSGLMGDYISDFLLWAFGWGRFFLPIVFLAWGYMLYDDERFELRGSSYFGFIVMMLSLHLFFSLLIDRDAWDLALAEGSGGGQIGFALAGLFITLMGFLSSLFVSLGLILISMLIIFDTSLRNLIGQDSLIGKLFYPFHFLINKVFPRKQEEEGEEENEEQEEEREEENEENEEGGEEEGEEEGEQEEEHEDDEGEEEAEEDHEDEEEHEDEEDVEEPEFMPRKPAVKVKEKQWWEEPSGIELNIPLKLLNLKKGKPTSGDIDGNKEKIRKTLEDFGIRVDMKGVSVGPTVTQYTFRPADGVKVSKITNLSNDLALALAAESVRIEAPIPGKPLVGIEVPNFTKAMVGLRDILGSSTFKERKKDSMLALGKDVSGKPRLADITTMPHLLVAGTTGSGKSVCLNTIIISLMYQNNPDDLRFIMVDPKRVELTPYNNIPYLLTPVITDIKKTINALKWCLGEMDRRYETLRESGNKNIQSYNDAHDVKMPYIVFIIDELADLMVTDSKGIEGSIIRLAQMSRAVGIHLILATQRPSVNVITGLIKANMPSRIAFAVASSTDSRTILDSQGAEKLIGRGDMLFMNAETPKPIRLQGAYLSEEEINKVTSYVRSKGKRMRMVDDVTEARKTRVAGPGGGIEIENADDLFFEARDAVVSMGKASTTLLQRKLGIGYSRAAKIIDQLEDSGIIGPGRGSKAREILITKQQLFEMDESPVSGVAIHDPKESKPRGAYLEEDDIPPVFIRHEDEEESDDSDEVESEDEGEEVENEEEDADEVVEIEGDEEDEEVVKKKKKEEENEMFFAR